MYLSIGLPSGFSTFYQNILDILYGLPAAPMIMISCMILLNLFLLILRSLRS